MRYLKRSLRKIWDRACLSLTRTIPVGSVNLRPVGDVTLASIMVSSEIEADWNRTKEAIDSLGIPDGTGGINPGDRQAVFYLARAFCPTAVLEIGTHIGASTMHLAAALSVNMASGGPPAHLATVDILDVNDTQAKPWLAHGVASSPKEMVERLGFDQIVNFVTSPSLEYMAACLEKYDFIFLDGDHSARTNYQEIPAALNLLNSGGILLLHDYYPNLETLWPGCKVIPGPFLAVRRLLREGAGLTPVPLGELLWATKKGARISSLALIMKR